MGHMRKEGGEKRSVHLTIRQAEGEGRVDGVWFFVPVVGTPAVF